MQHLVSNGYIQYILAILSILRISHLGLEDSIFNLIRNFITGVIYIEEPIAGTDRTVKVRKDLEVGFIRAKLRELFACHWCLPFWITLIVLGLTLIFPHNMTYFNLLVGSSYLVSVLYGRYS